ncbi:MAG: PilN domain-containing protein [Bacteroidota bacterium]
MVTQLKTYLLYGNTYCSIEHNSSNSVEAILLKKKKAEVVIEKTVSSKTVAEIAEKLPKKQHAFLIVNNDAVLSKFIESTEKQHNRLLYEAFPNLKINDFYFEIDSHENFHNIAICRKSTVDKLIEAYQKQHITIIGFSLGNVMTSFVNNFIEAPSYYTSNALLTKEDNQITGISLIADVPTQIYTINGLEVQNTQLLNFAGALSYILQTKKTVSNFEETETTLITDFRQKRFFSQFIMFGLGFILLILLLNFFTFNSYYESVENMKQTAAVNSSQKEKLLKLKALVDEKQKTVDDILKNSSSRSSYYIDAIANSLPNTIQLAGLTYQPITKRIKKKKAIQLTQNTITISGISTDSDLFSDWIQTLESFDWIANVMVVNYGSQSKNTTDFSLKIQLSNE